MRSEEEKRRQAAEGTRRYRAAHPDKIAAANARWYAEHKELSRETSYRWREAHPDQHRENQARWRRENPDKYYELKMRRKARANGYKSAFSIPEWGELVASYSSVCVYCGQKSSNLEPDHIVPVSRGGSSDIENIAPACKRCNSGKKDRPMLVFMATSPRLHHKADRE